MRDAGRHQPANGKGGKRHPTLQDNVIIGSGAQIIGPIVVGERARVGANAVVTEDVPAGATMVGIKARSTLVPAEAWMREFVPYGTPCDDPPCDEEGRPRRDCIEKLEGEIAQMREEMAAMKALLAEREAVAAKAHDPAHPLGSNVEPAVRLRKRATKD